MEVDEPGCERHVTQVDGAGAGRAWSPGFTAVIRSPEITTITAGLHDRALLDIQHARRPDDHRGRGRRL